MYLVSGTRPDSVYTFTHFAQFNSSPAITHLTAAKPELRHPQGVKDKHLLYPWNNQLKMTTYTDSFHHNCLDRRRTVSGYIF